MMREYRIHIVFIARKTNIFTMGLSAVCDCGIS